MRKFLTLAVVVALVCGSSMAYAGSDVDVVFIVDTSGSMSGEHTWLSSMIGSLNTKLAAKGLTGEYSLVSFGGSGSGDPVEDLDSGTSSQFSSAVTALTASGGTEDGYEAIQFALDNLTLGTTTNFILVTDEDRDVTTSDSYSSIVSALQRGTGTADDILLNVVVNAARYGYDSNGQYGILDYAMKDANGANLIGMAGDGTYGSSGASGATGIKADGSGGYTTVSGSTYTTTNDFVTTYEDYVKLAWDTGGLAWDLNELRAGGNKATSFTAAFTDIKVEEITSQVVPVPPAALAGLALLGGLGVIRRIRRRKQ